MGLEISFDRTSVLFYSQPRHLGDAGTGAARLGHWGGSGSLFPPPAARITGRNSPARNTEPVTQIKSAGLAAARAACHAWTGSAKAVAGCEALRRHTSKSFSGG